MIAATIRSEWIKLQTVRVNYVLGLVALAFPLVVTTLTAIFRDDLGSSSVSRDHTSVVTGTGIVSAMLLAVVAAISLTGEFSYGTIRPTFAATPRRLQVLLVKAFVNFVTVVVAMTLIIAICWITGAVILNSREADIGLSSDDGTLGAVIGLIALAGILSLFGYAVALLIRNAAATVSIVLLWPLIVENLIAGLMFAVGVEGLTRWLPYAAGIQVALVEPDSDSLGRVSGGLYFAAVSLALMALGVFANQRRDA